MPRKIRDISKEEMASLLLDLLGHIRENILYSSRYVRESFAKRKDLAEDAVRTMMDILSFSDFVRTRYYGFPARPHYYPTLKGLEILRHGRFALEDFAEAPEWVKRWVKRHLPPFKAVLFFLVSSPQFPVAAIWVPEDWNYAIYVETPLEQAWEDWQKISPTDVLRYNIHPSSVGFVYSPKLRALMFLEASRVLPNASREVGYRWVRLPEITATQRALRKPYTRIWDPDGRIAVQEIARLPDKVRWKVDLRPISHLLPAAFPVFSVKSDLEARYPARQAKIVDDVWVR